MKLSVVIPVYNVVATLLRCVDSVLMQDVEPLEVILVDDGSTDGSAALCDNIERQYTDDVCTIRVIHQANQGLSAARNAGIAASTGQLITFVDSDDFIERNTYAPIVQLFDADAALDVVEFPVDRFYNVITERTELTFRPSVYTSALHYLFAERAVMHAYAWNKVYRRATFVQPDAAAGEASCPQWFPVGRTFEDVFAMPFWLGRARKIATTDRGCYFYTLNTSGICRTAGRQQYRDRFEALLGLMQWIPAAQRSGSAYGQIYEQALNVRKDHGGRLPIPRELAPSPFAFGPRALVKYILYLLGR